MSEYYFKTITHFKPHAFNLFFDNLNKTLWGTKGGMRYIVKYNEEQGQKFKFSYEKICDKPSTDVIFLMKKKDKNLKNENFDEDTFVGCTLLERKQLQIAGDNIPNVSSVNRIYAVVDPKFQNKGLGGQMRKYTDEYTKDELNKMMKDDDGIKMNGAITITAIEESNKRSLKVNLNNGMKILTQLDSIIFNRMLPKFRKIIKFKGKKFVFDQINFNNYENENYINEKNDEKTKQDLVFLEKIRKIYSKFSLAPVGHVVTPSKYIVFRDQKTFEIVAGCEIISDFTQMRILDLGNMVPKLVNKVVKKFSIPLNLSYVDHPFGKKNHEELFWYLLENLCVLNKVKFIATAQDRRFSEFQNLLQKKKLGILGVNYKGSPYLGKGFNLTSQQEDILYDKNHPIYCFDEIDMAF